MREYINRVLDWWYGPIRYKFTIDGYGPWMFFHDLESFVKGMRYEIENMEKDEEWNVRAVRMTDEEFSKLPEFEGW